MSRSLFSKDPRLQERAREITAAAQPAPKTLAILFTPRSGSSWLSDVLSQTDRLGRTREWFNPNFVPQIAAKLGAQHEVQYLDLLRRRQQVGGFFAFKATMFHLERVFDTPSRFAKMLPDPVNWCYLRREDIVLQAVSLAKAVHTDVFHATNRSDDEIAASDNDFAYDAGLIEEWCQHIFVQEQRCEKFLSRRNIRPWRLSYEMLARSGSDLIAQSFLSRYTRALDEGFEVTGIGTPHRKIASIQNLEFADRFRRDRKRLVEKIALFRAKCPVHDTHPLTQSPPSSDQDIAAISSSSASASRKTAS